MRRNAFILALCLILTLSACALPAKAPEETPPPPETVTAGETELFVRDALEFQLIPGFAAEDTFAAVPMGNRRCALEVTELDQVDGRKLKLISGEDYHIGLWDTYSRMIYYDVCPLMGETMTAGRFRECLESGERYWDDTELTVISDTPECVTLLGYMPDYGQTKLWRVYPMGENDLIAFIGAQFTPGGAVDPMDEKLNPILTAAMDELYASLRFAPQLTPEEADTLTPRRFTLGDGEIDVTPDKLLSWYIYELSWLRLSEKGEYVKYTLENIYSKEQDDAEPTMSHDNAKKQYDAGLGSADAAMSEYLGGPAVPYEGGWLVKAGGHYFRLTLSAPGEGELDWRSA